LLYIWFEGWGTVSVVCWTFIKWDPHIILSHILPSSTLLHLLVRVTPFTTCTIFGCTFWPVGRWPTPIALATSSSPRFPIRHHSRHLAHTCTILVRCSLVAAPHLELPSKLRSKSEPPLTWSRHHSHCSLPMPGQDRPSMSCCGWAHLSKCSQTQRGRCDQACPPEHPKELMYSQI
jgi:hypothetical protein